ncbi:putative transcriptional regulator, GntR family [Cellulosilyticum lentocellum DSM 5427]|uniref:Putative transcriptional regulator, GntR family n=2 Tax=Cellulosilyticum lentocellum TaxID=29360 RepID=F2JIC3_CELLD|nr:aminotransferase class I/II-fold pyridoxal phosphate-dependent enzyme [Cellulosilyticum lentocellum]ADZ84289.1 putative transcriptional regulator, GntR family [Cellulosilyticum lentocellum DSM 5427]
MLDFTKCSVEQLMEEKQLLEKKYADYVGQKLKLDMSRGKPASTQLDLNNDILSTLETYITEDGTDARNYGVLDGLSEAKKLFSELLNIAPANMIIGGNSSLNLMYDAMTRLFLFGTEGERPWCQLDQVKFLCPSPGYDRHFAICEDLGIEMITVPMHEDGPDMDYIESLVKEDASIKGIWCVPLYSNPQGICYSDEVVERLASMKTAAKDFRIFWDNAYGVHHIYDEVKLKDIFEAARAAGNENRVYYFFSTSKITFPGAGVALIASSLSNIAEIKKHMSIQTIGHDKLNQLRTVNYFKNAEGIRTHMKKLGNELRPKFEIVLNTLEKELAGTGLLSWTKPQGGYFVAVDTLPGCAKETVRLAKEAGVVLTGAGATFPYQNDPQDRNIRIAPTYPTVEELQKAMELFCVCVKLAGVNRLLIENQ